MEGKEFSALMGRRETKQDKWKTTDESRVAYIAREVAVPGRLLIGLDAPMKAHVTINKARPE